jgi:hypothetical protein
MTKKLEEKLVSELTDEEIDRLGMEKYKRLQQKIRDDQLKAAEERERTRAAREAKQKIGYEKLANLKQN